MIHSFEFTNLNTMQIFRFEKRIHQKQLIPAIGELQRNALFYLFERDLVGSVSETSSKINPDGDLITMQIVGSEAERFFVKIKMPKCEENGEEDTEEIQLRLQAYENTGLSPEGIAALIADNKRLHKLVDSVQKVLEGKA